MSTRSGKRIHASSDSPIVDPDLTLQSNRKTRSRKQKENIELSVVKKRHNYVSYPSEEDIGSVSTDDKVKGTGKPRKNALKELNVHAPPDVDTNNVYNTIRKSRRGKKIEELSNGEDLVNIQNHAKSESVANDKKKNKKKKNHKNGSMEVSDMQDVNNQVVKKKASKKKKNGLNSMTNDQHAEHLLPGMDDTSDSFHSAAGSPIRINNIGNDYQTEVPANISGHKSEETFVTTDNELADVTITKVKTSKKGKKFEKNDIKDNDIDNKINNQDTPPVISMASNITMELATKKKRKSSIKNSAFDKIEEVGNAENLNMSLNKKIDKPTAVNTIVDISSKKRKRSSMINTTIDNMETSDLHEGNLNTTFDKITNGSGSLNTTIDVPKRKRRKTSIKNTTFDKIETNEKEDDNEKCFNSTFDHKNNASNGGNDYPARNSDKSNATFTPTQNINVQNDTIKTSNNNRKSSVMNCTYDKIDKEVECNEIKDKDATFDKDDAGLRISIVNKESPGRRKSLHTNNISNNSEQMLVTSTRENSSEGITKTNKLDSTFSRDNNLNTTFDTGKISESSGDSKKSSLISSDATVNLTFDKSEDYSRISITSDESKTENILNQTPVIIESSIEESLISEDRSPVQAEVPVTPLKREDTFTKEVSDVVGSPKPKESVEKTPIRRKSSPGCTPFPFSKSSQKENAKLNVTRSIEKSLRRSSLEEVAPRQTRVMFCSPANNPAVVSQVKGRVIKSNLKGSNKSFVFDESVSSDTRAVRRKRSLTVGAVSGAGSGAAGDAETRAKRKRLGGDELQHSVDRLSRPRTQSAAAKLSEPVTSCNSPGRVSRTRLPDFAALHRKQFARMESLDECQARRARRARHLLTPTGSTTLIERISPTGTSPKPAPAKEQVAKPQAAAKLHTPSKPKVPTLESMIPRYTRFGFKMDVEENPFSVVKEVKPARQTCLPSLAGAAVGGTGVRRAVARQTVMREKSFSEKRSVKRTESRTVIKGVRTNRRFELQMKMRNINA